MDTRSKIEEEMTYTSWDGSCRDPYLTLDCDLRQCRRASGHDGNHASGFGKGFRTWER